MKLNRRWMGFALLLSLVVATSGCISIEQEIFLQPDGSGDLLLHIGLPDLPNEAKNSPLGANNPVAEMEKFRKEVVEKLPPTIKLIEAKQTQRNGTNGFYAVFRFKDIREVQSLMNQALQKSTEGMPPKENATPSKPPEWSLRFEKQNGVTQFTQMFFADLSDAKAETSGDLKVGIKSAPAPKAPARQGRRTATRKTTSTFKPPTKAPDAPGFEMNAEGMEGLASLFLAAIKFRFVLHTPTPIKDSNADFVINNGKSALWDCSLAAFAKEKKPIEMKATF